MRRVWLVGLLVVAFGGLVAASRAEVARERTLLDIGWKFHFGHDADMDRDFGYGSSSGYAKAGQTGGPPNPRFDTSGWQKVNLPHDWVVSLPFVQDADKDVLNHGSKPVGPRYPDTSVGWYRRTFRIPQSDLGKRITLEFDGVFRDCIVWVNGHQVARNQSGYIGFSADITDVLNYGDDNVLAVRVDASQYEGWFYEGAGIYRHVWLVKTDPVHVPQWGTYVTSEVHGKDALVTIRTEVANESDNAAKVAVKSDIYGPAGDSGPTASTGCEVAPWATETVVQKVTVRHLRLWSPETPNLYRLTTHLELQSKGLVDSYDTTFGIRTLRFDADHGFFLNGKHVFIQGTCNHQDHAGVGVALPDHVQAFRVATLKDMGCNAYRTAHGPPAPELLDECDRQGMMVMDENRLLDTSAEGKSQLDRLIRRDRNHPSIILWSLCNEEWTVQSTIRGERMMADLVREAKSLDDTRGITCAASNGADYEGVNAAVPIRGVNYYHFGDILKYRSEHPTQPMVGSEDASTTSTRGEYANDPAKGYVAAYDNQAPRWGCLAEEWYPFYVNHPFFAGAFMWTGFEYRGEPTPYGWPEISSNMGPLDTCGFPKDTYYYFQAHWRPDMTVVHLLPHWNWAGKEGQNIDVWCYSNTDEVELFLNGKSLGRKTMPPLGHVNWAVPYAPGRLEARGYSAGKLVGTDVVETTGPAARIVLRADQGAIRGDGEDVAVVAVSVVDAQGRVVPTAGNDVALSIDGGQFLGVGNGDPGSHEADQFLPDEESEQVTGWSNTTIPALPDNVSSLDWSHAAPVDGARGAGTSWVAYHTNLELDPAMAGYPRTLSISGISGAGAFYVNGVEVGRIARGEDWSDTVAKASPLLRPGDNSLVVVVQTGRRMGWFGQASLSWEVPAPTWRRKVFHGLAQAIAGATLQPGKMTITASAEGLESAKLEVAVR
jgi:beta-galactosidase